MCVRSCPRGCGIRSHRLPSQSSSPVRLAALALALAGTLLLAGFTPWPVTKAAWREAVTGQVATATGARNVDIGDINFTLLPSPRLDVTRVAVDAEGTTVSGTAETARFALSPLLLLTGTASITDITLNGADLMMRVPGLPSFDPRAMAAHIGQASGALQAVRAQTGLQRLVLRRSTLDLASAHGAHHTVAAVDLEVALPASTDPIRLAMSGTWQNEPIRFSFSGASGASRDAATMEPVSLSFSAADWKADFKGQGHFARDAALKGAVQASFSGLPLFSQPARGHAGEPRMRTVLSAIVDGTTRGATLSDLMIRRNDDRFVGVGAARMDNGRWHLSATLATEQADLSWLTEPLLRLRDDSGGWSSQRIAIDEFLGFNLDLRLSADKLRINRSLFERAALTLLNRATRFEATLGDARLNGGTVRARAIASTTTDGIDLKVSANLDGADIAATTSEFGIERRLRGSGTGAISFDASGRSAAELVASSNGRFHLLVRNGDILGIDLFRLADRKPSRPSAALTEALTGKTSFETLTLNSRITQGAVGPIDGRMQAGRIVGALQGTVDLSQGQHNLNGTVVQVGGDTFQIEPVPVLEFSVSGPLTAPRFEPNIQALMNRS